MAKRQLPFKLVTLDEKEDVLLRRASRYGAHEFVYLDEDGNVVEVDKVKIVQGTKKQKELKERYRKTLKLALIGKTIVSYATSSYRYGPRKHTQVVINEAIFNTIVDDDSKIDWYKHDYRKIDDLLKHVPDLEAYQKDSSFYFSDNGNKFGRHLKVSFVLSNHTKQEFTYDEMLDNSLWKYNKNDYVEVTRGGEKVTAQITELLDSGIKLLYEDGTTRTGVKVNALSKATKPTRKLTLEMLPEEIKKNMEDALESPHLQVFKVTKGIQQVEGRQGVMREEEKDFITCSYCETETPIAACIGCKKTYREILRVGDKALLNVGPDPKSNSVCIAETKCCDNCNHFNFGYGRNGKRANGYCSFMRLCVRAYNTCDRWMPVGDKEYSSHLKCAMTNLAYGINRYGNKDISEFNYTKELHEENKKKANKLRQNYVVGYANFIEMLKEKHGI